jgi:hypothetical protein
MSPDLDAMQTTQHIAESLPVLMPCTFDYMDQAMDVENSIRMALQVRSPFFHLHLDGPICFDDVHEVFVAVLVLCLQWY